MPELQGYATFPGVQQVLHATYTRSHGISPGVCTMEIAPQLRPIVTKPATLKFLFGQTVLSFRDCIIDTSSLQASEGGYVTTLQIFDRRWKWAYSQIFGEYNRRDGDGKVIDSIDENEKTPYGLAKLLLKAMGEPENEGNNLPIEGRPYVKWEGANPARELAQLCEEFGFSVVLDTRDNLRIVKIGNGQSLPQNPLVMHFGTGLNPPEPPDAISVFGAPTRFQAWLKLKAVGLDTDGTVKPIDDLSYKPSTGWEKEPATFPNLQTTALRDALRHAMATVWRWFRITIDTVSEDSWIIFPRFTDDSFFMHSLSEESHLQYILPLSRELVQTEKVDGIVRRREAKVYGIYAKGTYGERYNSDEEPNNTTTTKTYDKLTTHKKKILYEGDFELLEQFGIVVFPQQVLQWDRTNGTWKAPELYLQCSFNARDKYEGTHAPHRYVYNSFIQGSGGAGQILYEPVPAQDRLQWQVYQDIPPGEKKTEWRFIIGREKWNLDDDAKQIAKAVASKYENIQSADATYAGLLFVSLDGAIRQITWNVGSDGATTQVSRNTESNPLVPHFRERRFLEVMYGLEHDAKARLPPIRDEVR